MRRVRAIALAILLLAGGAPGAGATTCTSDADCGANTYCLPDVTDVPSGGGLFVGGTCAVQTCTSDSDCDPSNNCFLGRCETGACHYDTRDCDDGDPCTLDSCTPTGSGNPCIHTEKHCDDGDPCTLDYCSQGKCASVPDSCDDKNACTTDSCDPTQGCVHTPSCTGTPGPMITGGATAASAALTARTGSCVPGALAVFLCSSNGFGPCHTAGDLQITGATFTPPNPSSPLSVVTIVLPSPPAPLMAGQKLYFTDGCTDPLLSAPATVSEPTPVMSRPMILLLTALLGLIALLALGRERWRKG